MDKIIQKNYSKEYEIKKSKFICCLFYINNSLEANKYLKEIKEKYSNANHYCYGYITCGKEKCSDDKEPSGTAGIPILNILKRKQLNNILCVVVRYFGGIKLGASNLLRAYTNSVINALNDVLLIPKIDTSNIKIIFSYENIKNIDFSLKNYEIISKNFDEDISYIIKIPKSELDIIVNKIKTMCKKLEIMD